MPPARLPKYVHAYGSRGAIYHYFRRGRFNKRLLGSPDEPSFWAEYARLLNATQSDPKPARFADGSVGALIASYKASSDFTTLKPTTRQSYARHLDMLAPVAPFPVCDLRSSHLRDLAEPLRVTPAKQQRFRAVMSLAFNWAAQNDYSVAPHLVPRFKRAEPPDSRTAWSNDDCARFDASNPPTHLRTACMLGRFTGQRRGDVLRLTWSSYDGDTIKLVPEKTKKRGKKQLVIPVLSPLKAYLDALPRTDLLLVTTKDGRPLDGSRLSKNLRHWLDAIGLTHLSFHGLRATAADMFAEAGCSSMQIQAITGTKTLQSIERYTQAADQRQLARDAVAKVELKLDNVNKSV